MSSWILSFFCLKRKLKHCGSKHHLRRCLNSKNQPHQVQSEKPSWVGLEVQRIRNWRMCSSVYRSLAKVDTGCWLQKIVMNKHMDQNLCLQAMAAIVGIYKQLPKTPESDVEKGRRERGVMCRTMRKPTERCSWMQSRPGSQTRPTMHQTKFVLWVHASSSHTFSSLSAFISTYSHCRCYHHIPWHLNKIRIVYEYDMSRFTMSPPGFPQKSHHESHNSLSTARRTYVDAIALEYAKRAEATGADPGVTGGCSFLEGFTLRESNGGKGKPWICQETMGQSCIEWWFSICLWVMKPGGNWCLVGFNGDVIGVWWLFHVFCFMGNILWFHVEPEGVGSTTRADSPVCSNSPQVSGSLRSWQRRLELLGVSWCFQFEFWEEDW